MKLKLSEVLAAVPAMAEFGRKELPARAAYRVAKIVRKMNAAARDHDEARRDAIKRLGEPITMEGGEPAFKLKPEHREAFEQEMKALLAEDVEMEGCAVIPWADVEKLTLAPVLLADLHQIIEAPKEDANGAA